MHFCVAHMETCLLLNCRIRGRKFLARNGGIGIVSLEFPCSWAPVCLCIVQFSNEMTEVLINSGDPHKSASRK